MIPLIKKKLDGMIEDAKKIVTDEQYQQMLKKIDENMKEDTGMTYKEMFSNIDNPIFGIVFVVC